MLSFFHRLLQHALSHEAGAQAEFLSRYRLAKAFYLLRLTVAYLLRDVLLVIIGVVVAGLGLKSFLLPNNFIDGGVTGISLLVSAVTGYKLGILLVVLNIPFMLLAYRHNGHAFALKSVVAISLLALAITFIPYPLITTDRLLIATFGGFFLGAGIGLAIRGGAVLDGTEVLAIYLSRRSSLSVGDVILIFNILIFSVAAYLLGFETAMYATLTYLAAAKTVDFIIEGLEEYIGVTVVSTHYEEVRRFIVEHMNVGVTIYAGLRGHGKRHELHHTEIIFTVITRLEVNQLKQEVKKIDPNAFVVMSHIRSIEGGIIRKRAVDHHT